MRRLLIANRGEIAVRIAKTARELGIETVAVYSAADRAAPHTLVCDFAVEIGPSPAVESYLSIENILDAARRVGADAVHPGYGFLSENPDFADAVIAAGLAWIGPDPSSMRTMGDKIAARAAMLGVGVPVVPGFQKPGATDADLAAAAAGVGLPLLVKASAGGGGKGMRRVEDGPDLSGALESARREAESAFGRGDVYLEKEIARPRHVEFQIFGDRSGNVLALAERECSIQRRHQKIVEEAPCVGLDREVRAAMSAAAEAAGRTVSYVGAGTVEFLLDAEKNFYFLEMNTRLQVEHPITEETLGIDLVAGQISVARGEGLPAGWKGLAPRGHAIECRVYAEDPETWLPRTGEVLAYEEPSGPGVRVDSGIQRGSVVGIDYDPLLAKLIVRAETRDAAIARMSRALRSFVILGVETNLSLLVRIVESTEFAAGRTDTSFLSRLPPRAESPASRHLADVARVAAAAFSEGNRAPCGAKTSPAPDPWRAPSGWRTG